MNTVEEVCQLRAACAFLSTHAEYLVSREGNVVRTLLAYPGYMRARGFVAPPSPAPAAAPPPPPPAALAPAPARPAAPSQPDAGPSMAQMLAEIAPEVVYERRKQDVLRAQGKTPPAAGDEPAPPAGIDAAAVYERRRQDVLRASGRAA